MIPIQKLSLFSNIYAMLQELLLCQFLNTYEIAITASAQKKEKANTDT